MHYPFLVTDPRSGLQYRLTDTGLAELSLAPISAAWAPGRAIAEANAVSDRAFAEIRRLGGEPRA